MKKKSILFLYRNKILIWIIIILIISLAVFYGIDKKFIVFIAFIIGVFTEIFAGFGVLVAAIPIIGPMIIKVVSIPVFWVLNVCDNERLSVPHLHHNSCQRYIL